MCDNKSNKEIAMTPENREKIELLRDTFRLNYELTRLYASYLEKCPELITREMVEMLLEDGELRSPWNDIPGVTDPSSLLMWRPLGPEVWEWWCSP